MSNLKSLVILISILAFLISCGNEDVNNDGLIDETESNFMNECDEMENSIMNECFENRLASKTSIANNLIGEWILIGYCQTVFPDTPQPEITLDFNDSLVVFENQTANIIDTLQWEMEEISTGNGQSYRLNIEGNYTELGIQAFCEKYMYLQTWALTSTIGYTYIYEKTE